MAKLKLRGYGFRPAQSYSSKEIADRLGIAETTVLEWIRVEKLPAMKNGKPYLVLGCDIVAYIQLLRGEKPQLADDEFFCMHCRRPRKAAGGMADFLHTKKTTGVLKALCEVCEGSVSRGIGVTDLPRLRAIFDITA